MHCKNIGGKTHCNGLFVDRVNYEVKINWAGIYLSLFTFMIELSSLNSPLQAQISLFISDTLGLLTFFLL